VIRDLWPPRAGRRLVLLAAAPPQTARPGAPDCAGSRVGATLPRDAPGLPFRPPSTANRPECLDRTGPELHLLLSRRGGPPPPRPGRRSL